MATQQRSSLYVWRCAMVLALAIGASASAAADVTHLLIVGTNDFHGALASKRQADGSWEGGLALLTGYVDNLRRENRGRVIWLDAGDEFQGSIESNSTEGAIVVRAFNAAGVTAAAIGNHEFDFGAVGPDDSRGDPRGALRARIAEARYPFLTANIVQRSTGRSPFEHGTGSILRKVAGIRVGVIGVTTTTAGVTTWPPFVRDLELTDLRTAVLREAAELRQRGAEVVLLIAHAGIKCDDSAPCEGELADLLHALPPETVDAVVSGHSHSVVEARIGGVPVVQAQWKGKFINVIDLPFDRVARRVVRENIRIEGPIVVRAPAIFHGRAVKPDPAVERILRPVLLRVKSTRERVLATAERPLDLSEERESAMGNLVTDALRELSGADVAILNAGGIRAALSAGPITFGAAFEALPFENKVAVLRVSGRELKTILRVAESGAMGYFPVAGLRLTIDTCERCPADDLDDDGRIADWEINRLVAVTRDDGSPIQDKGEYTLATTDFVLQGGDYMGWPIGRVSPERIRYTSLLARDALVTFLQTHRRINTDAAPLIDASHPRMLFVGRDEAVSRR